MPSQPPEQPGSSGPPQPPGDSQPPGASRPPPDGDDTSPTEVFLSEARRVVDEQIKELDRTDRKAARSLQGMFVLFGLLISAQEFLNPEPVWSWYIFVLVGMGVGGWVVGVVAMLFAYSSSDASYGAVTTMRNHSDIDAVTSDSVRTRILEEYSAAVDKNETMILINTRALIIGQLTAIVGTVAIGLLLLVWL